MGKAKFSQIFDTGLSADISEIFGSTVIEKCSLDTDERALNAELKSEKYITAESRNELVNQLKNALKLNECHISCIFSEDALIPAACAASRIVEPAGAVTFKPLIFKFTFPIFSALLILCKLLRSGIFPYKLRT